MHNPKPRTTPIELALWAWTALSVAVGVWVLLTSKLRVFGSGTAIWIPLAFALAASWLLLWKLLKPTRLVLLFGTLYWALQIVSVRFPDALYAFGLGLTVEFRLTNDPDLVVAINLLALVVTAVFAVSTVRRWELETRLAAS